MVVVPLQPPVAVPIKLSVLGLMPEARVPPVICTFPVPVTRPEIVPETPPPVLSESTFDAAPSVSVVPLPTLSR